MSDIAKLTVALYANSAQFVSELDKSNKKAQSWSSKVKGSFSVAAAATAAAATAAAGAIALIYNQQAALIDQTAKMADSLGMTTEAYTQLRHAANLTGAAEAFDGAMESMVIKMGEATLGSGEAKEALDILGLSAEALGKMTPEQQLLTLADALKQVENQSQRTFLTDQIFGGPEMMVMLNQGSAGIKAMADEADRLGITLSRLDAAKVEMANDAMYKVNMTTQAIYQSMTTQLAPFVAAMAESFLDYSQQFGGMNNMIAEGIHSTTKGVGFLADSLHGVKIIIESLNVAWQAVEIGFIAVSQAIVTGLHELGKFIFQVVVSPLQAALDLAGNFSDEAAQMAADLRKFSNMPAPQIFDTSTINQAKLDLNEALWELRTLASEPLPSEGVEQWYQNTKARFDQLAKDYAKTISYNTPDSNQLTAGGADSNKEDKAVSSFREATRQLEVEYQRRLALQAAGEQQAATQEAFAYADRQIQLSEQFQAAYEAAANNQTLQQELEDQYFASREVLWQDHQSRLTEIELAEQKKRRDFQSKTAADLLTFTQQQMQITMGVLQDAGQESSTVYKMLFAMQKAAAIPSMIVATEEAAIKAMAAFPGPAGLTMAGAVRALGYASVGMVGAQAVMGMAHDGIDAVPREGTWLLDRGERVYTNQSAQKIDSMYNRVMGGQPASQGESKQPWSIIIHEAPAGTTAEVDDEKRVIAIMMKDANSGGQYISYIQQKLGVRPGGYK